MVIGRHQTWNAAKCQWCHWPQPLPVGFGPATAQRRRSTGSAGDAGYELDGPLRRYPSIDSHSARRCGRFSMTVKRHRVYPYADC